MSANTLEESLKGDNPIMTIIFVIISLLFIILSGNKKKMPRMGSWLVLFLSYVIIVSIVHGFQIGFERKTAVLIYMQPLLLFSVEYYAQQDEKIKRWTPYLVKALALWILSLFVINYQKISFITREAFHITNSSYYLLYFLPMLFLFLKENHRKYMFIITLVVIILSSKRSGFLALGLGFLSYYFTINKKQKNNKKILSFLLVLIVIYFVFNWINSIMDGRLLERFESASDDRGSGRLDVWLYVWTIIQDSSLLNLLFGHGFNSVILQTDTDYSAHNDFLEIIFDFGWIGFVLFIAFLISSIVFLKRLSKTHSTQAPVLSMALLIFMTNCIFSHIIIYSECLSLFTLYFGALCGLESEKK